MPDVTGNGYGIDLSLSAMLLKKIRVAAAVNNIGAVTYNTNVYTVRDTLVTTVTMPGLDDYDATSSMQQLVQDGSIMSLVGQEEMVIQNPATFRMGGSIELGKMFNVGLDVIAPFNADAPGSLQNAVVSVGGDFKPVEWLHISAGYFGGGIYANNIPVGINFVLGGGTYEFGIASRDALSFFLRDGKSISMAFGFESGFNSKSKNPKRWMYRSEENRLKFITNDGWVEYFDIVELTEDKLILIHRKDLEAN